MRRLVRTVRKPGVDHIQLLFVRRERDTVGLDKVIDDNLDVSALRIHAIDVVLFLLGSRLDALVIPADAIGRIGEPDRTVRSNNRVVRRVQPLAVVLVRNDGDRAVEFGPGDPSAAMFTRDQASFAIDGVAVRVHRRLTEYAEVTVIVGEAHDAVIGNVAEQQISTSRKVDRALGPTHPGGDALNCHGSGESWKTVRPEGDVGLFERL